MLRCPGVADHSVFWDSGFNTYNAAGCTINQTIIQSYINAFSSQGFKAAGYNIFGIDCGWQGIQRQSNGSITYDARGFPGGIAPLSKSAISKGFVRICILPASDGMAF